ncbi:exodeoxyribonuclease V subunit gamma [Candidatus Pacearchaeota archaeon]|nr:exodeoxyribonuclease V subunit gamma [Candidatus Pacearchaeota archaeon]
MRDDYNYNESANPANNQPMSQADEEAPHIHILRALTEIPFTVGKKLLSDFVFGKHGNASIIKNNLDDLPSFGSLDDLRQPLIMEKIDNLILKGLIDQSAASYNHMVKVLSLTLRGRNEIVNPKMIEVDATKNNYEYKSEEITEQDRSLFDALGDFLGRYNDEQKKAITSPSKNILCIAGAGSGKTSVLTKRIEFLCKYRSVPREKVLAITFTRKAKEEMQARLQELGVLCYVETFNSFCEKILQKHTMKIYGREIRMINYRDKILAMGGALDNIGMDMPTAINNYFSMSQRINKTPEQLQHVLMNDCFSVLDYYKIKGKAIEDFSKDADLKNFNTAKMIYKICKFLEEFMKVQCLRDYTDQVLDATYFFESEKDFMPKFDYILVDEYQDVNESQIKLLDVLNAENMFCVGDPRQSIFGWRGSDTTYIKNFGDKYTEAATIILKKNYRSNNHIVSLMNASIKEMELPDVVHNYEGENEIYLKKFESYSEEYDYVARKICESTVKRKDIFVLARTNRILNEVSTYFNQRNISHVLKTDENRKPVEAVEGQITLATIHSIKGLEAEKVFVIGCNEKNFPCKVSDHPVLEMIKMDDYDKLDEEKRLFYVAISRAKSKLHLTYNGKKQTSFITPEMENLMN